MANKKQRDTAKADADMKAKREAQMDTGDGSESKEEKSDPADMLAAEDDEDIIF